ncbi:MAG: virulence RhuM family protein [Bacteroidales bacterium]|nr:virulence RhuM family protein [Bacteroidales bacterium]
MNTGEIILYQPDNSIRLEMRMENVTVWLTQAQMAMLFQRSISDISRHIRKIFTEGELDEKSNLHFLQIANSDKPVAFFSLDVIISVGYRVKSIQGTRFRQWANSILKAYLLRGYAINQRIQIPEQYINRQLQEHAERIHNLENKVDFFVRTALPPVEGVFYEGQIFYQLSFSGKKRKLQRKVAFAATQVDC